MNIPRINIIRILITSILLSVVAVTITAAVMFDGQTWHRWYDQTRDFIGLPAHVDRTVPEPRLDAQRVIKVDDGVPILWNTPVKQVTYTLPEGVQSRMSYYLNKKITVIRIVNYEQGKKIPLRITGAVAVNGQKMKTGNHVETLITTTPLGVAISPVSGTLRAPRDATIMIDFSEPISNPEVAKEVFSVEPKMDGELSWPSSTKLVFKPSAKWEYDTAVKVKIRNGGKRLVGDSGNVIDGGFTATFQTAPLKMIDVDLSKQFLVALEDGNQVFTCYTVTGKSGYSTPAGNYRIYGKDKYVRMNNSPSDPEPYDLDNVPNVMWVVGGVAIHGAYWRSSFGYTGSHGCVNVSVDDSEWLFNWAPVGTPVFIHY